MRGTVEIKNGIYDLLISGSVVVNGTDSTELTLTSAGELQPLKFIIKFENEDTEPSRPRKLAKVVDATTLEMIFTNYNNSFGSFAKEPWYLGSIINRKLYFVYVIYGFANAKIKKIDYSFYLGEEIVNG